MTENSDLQFERAQFDGAAPQPECQMCKTPLHGSYFEANGETVCERCCYTLREGGPTGSRAGRVLRAIGAGLGAALGGAILYWAILAATGYEFGLIAIVVGFAVGKAVHWGSRGRGGWAYQALAIGLTYMSIVSAYVPMIFTEPTSVTEALAAPPDDATADDATADDATADEATAADATAADATAADATAADATAADATATEVAPAEARRLGLVGLIFALGIVLAIPFLLGFQNIIGLIIIGIGMYEAWKLNRRVELVITGPHALAAARVAPTPS